MPKDVIEGFRLSPQQKHLWSVQKAGQSYHYRAQCTLQLEGPLRLAALTAALDQLFNRHEILRTTFHSSSGLDVPLQVVAENNALSIQRYHWQETTPALQTARLEALFDEWSQQPFDLEQEPAWQVALISWSPTQHTLLIKLPALCADRVTLVNLLYEIGQAYQNQLTGEPLQYADLAEWQNELLEADDTASGRDYWRKQAWADLPTLKLFFEASPAAFEPQFTAIRLQSELTWRIDHLAQTYQVSPAAVWQSCWRILLWRYSGRPEVLVGLAEDGRPYDELKGALGLLTRFLPFNTVLDETTHFAELLVQTHQATQAAAQWQYFFDGEQPPASTPEFLPFKFEFAPPPEPLTAGEITLTMTRQYVCTDRFKAKLVVMPGPDGTIAELHYNAQVFNAADIERLAGQLGELLASAVSQPEAAIGTLNLLTPTERHTLLVEFNRTKAAFPLDGCVHHLFEAQAEQVPQRVAVMFEGQALTYQELNRRANQLAHYLQKQGVGPDSLVAIFVERSLDMIVGMLGILKAGGAYVPFDPTLPQERLAFLLDDTQAPVLLTQHHLLARLPDLPAGLHLVTLDSDPAAIIDQPEHNPTSGVQSHHLVYVLFTSGSTGQPKGVMVEHRNLLNYIHSITVQLDLPAEANYATVSTFAADLGHTVIFPALCGGGCLHIITHERAIDPDALAAYFHHYQLDCLKLVPSHLAALLASDQPEQIMPRQRLVLGGETSHWDLVRMAQTLAPDCRIFNHYGPTETTVGVLTYPVSKALAAALPDPTPATVPVGWPIANTQIYILDSSQRPVPLWVPGEIYIGGAGVARGYLNRPQLTAERFVQMDKKPFSSSPLYKTGDLARYLPDGSIEFLGRIDNQVKIRGFRIELGEIEALLSQHPAVRETVVLAREDQPGDKRLVAYLVPAPNHTPTSTELRHFLKEKLPEPMLPTTFVLLDSLPLTANGKINHRALPPPDTAHLAFEASYLAPRSATEEALAELWANILGLERVGVRDNFFELGGHSLLAVRLISQIQRWFGRDIPLAALFQEGTIERLAIILDRQAETGPQSPLVKIQAAGSKLPFFCVHPADGTVLSYVALARYLGEDQPFYGLQVAQLDLNQRPQTRLKHMAAEYVAALRTVQPHGPYLLGGWSMGGVVAFEMAQQLQQQGQTVALLALLDSWTPDSDPRYPAGYPVPAVPQPVGADLETQLLIDFLRHLRGRYARELPPLPEDFRQLGPHEKLPYILEHAQMLESVFPEGGLAQIHHLLQVFKANVQAMANYVPQTYRGRIVLFQASEWFAAEQHPQGRMLDSAESWQRVATEPIEVRAVPGDHYTMLAEPNIQVLAKRLKVYLNQVALMKIVSQEQL